MESNKDEALKCLAIAQKHRNAGNYASAKRFCQKSLSLFSTAEAVKLLEDEVKEQPNNANALFHLGMGSQLSQQNKKAIDAYKRYLAM